MPLGSRRSSTLYLTYFATRTTTEAAFAEPELHDELVVEGANVSDAFLTDDGLVLYFARSVDGLSDLFVTRRPNVTSPFEVAVPLTTINTSKDDRDPWLSADGTVLYFSSDRDNPGTLNLYQARLTGTTSGTTQP
jgi:Tol biopolymer transport system component